MKKKLILLTVFIASLCLTSCKTETVEEENVVFGDIDTSKEYITEHAPLPSAVERKDEINIRDYFIKIPLNETAEKVSSTLPTYAGDKYAIDRVQLNGVYFDINQIANQNNYKLAFSDGIVQVIIPRDNGVPVIASVAQIGDKTNVESAISYDEAMEVSDIVNEYEEIYRNTENQSSNEYGNYYTYDKYVDWMNAHEHAKFDISMYSPEQILEYAIEVFNIDKKAEDFYINTNADLLECSDWYLVITSYRYEKENENTIEISLKSSSEGIFLFMTEYPPEDNIDIDGYIYYTPTMIINIAQNNYLQLAESYQSYINRQNYQNGF